METKRNVQYNFLACSNLSTEAEKRYANAENLQLKIINRAIISNTIDYIIMQHTLH